MGLQLGLQRPTSGLYVSITLLVCCLGLAATRPLADTSLSLSQIVWGPERSRQFVGSPAIARLANGSYLASHDDFGSGAVADTTHVYISSDRGQSWAACANIKGQYWSNLLVRGADVFLIGTASDGFAGDRSVVISKSSDGGRTWLRQVILAAPAAGSSYHTSSVPVVFAAGRYWRGVERWVAPRRWPQDFQAMQISAPSTDDLMNPANWKATPALAFNAAWNAPVTPSLPIAGFLEGNAVRRPDGSVGHLMRMPRLRTTAPRYVDLNHAILFTRTAANTLVFDRVVNMPGGGNMFNVRLDTVTKLYVALANTQAAAANGQDQRNVLQLLTSPDLVTWRAVATLLQDDTGLTAADSLRYTGFQYVAWQFEGGDLICVIRTAYRGAVNYHDSNRLTFFRVTNWRALLRAPNARVAPTAEPAEPVGQMAAPQQPTSAQPAGAPQRIPNVQEVLLGISPASGS